MRHNKVLAFLLWPKEDRVTHKSAKLANNLRFISTGGLKTGRQDRMDLGKIENARIKFSTKGLDLVRLLL
jgi:hypothetical protein